MHFSITFFKFEYCLTNFGKKSLKPIISSVTSIWPSQCMDAPIPIVGIETFFVINEVFSFSFEVGRSLWQ